VLGNLYGSVNYGGRSIIALSIDNLDSVKLGLLGYTESLRPNNARNVCSMTPIIEELVVTGKVPKPECAFSLSVKQWHQYKESTNGLRILDGRLQFPDQKRMSMCHYQRSRHRHRLRCLRCEKRYGQDLMMGRVLEK
jgi:hypothetical protein